MPLPRIRWPWAALAPAAKPSASSRSRRGQAGSPACEAECAASASPLRQPVTSKAKGDAAEALALAHLQAQGLRLLARNWRGPGRGAGELDLVMQTSDGTLVFVEVRARRSVEHGGAAASVDARKQQRTVRAAQHYLQQALAQGMAEPPPCRFDVVVLQGEGPERRVVWLPAAFDASAG